MWGLYLTALRARRDLHTQLERCRVAYTSAMEDKARAEERRRRFETFVVAVTAGDDDDEPKRPYNAGGSCWFDGSACCLHANPASRRMRREEDDVVSAVSTADIKLELSSDDSDICSLKDGPAYDIGSDVKNYVSF